MFRQKRNIKKAIFFVSLFIFLIFLANLTPISDLKSTSNDNFISNSPINYENESLNNANLNLTEFITGKGTDQTVRLCMENSSTSNNNQNGEFEIPSPNDDMNLNSGDFLFNFNNNYTTEYIVEDDSALTPIRYYEKYEYSPTNSYLIVNNGSIYPSDGFSKLLNKQRSFFNISSYNGLINFTVCANFAGVLGVGEENPDTYFNRERMLGFILNFTYTISKDANITIYIEDICDTGNFKNITNTFEVKNNTLTKSNIPIINENLDYINLSSCSLIRFVIDRTDKTNFNTTISVLNLTSFIGFELPITNNSLALDFDLRGLNSTINGCYLWIRTLNTTKVQTLNAILNISLYIANGTMSRDQVVNHDNFKVPVKPYQLLDSKIYYYNDYHGDNLTYFKFNLSKTYNLSSYNYFIVIKSNITTNGIFSLVTIPTSQFGGDGESREHLIEKLGSDEKWSIAKADLNSVFQLDASGFKLNVTRGYMPSDFEINGIKTLKIQNLTIENYIISGLSTNSPNLEWGLGRWNYTLNSSISSNNALDIFEIDLTWNNTYIKGFRFDINYTAEIYRSDNCTAYYKVNYDRLPEWEFNYTFNLGDAIFTHWNFTRLWYVYRNYFTAHNLTIPPDGTEVFNKLKEESLYSDSRYKSISLNSTIAENSGTYSLNLTSPNSIFDEHSYLNYKGILWETSGFMYGDNISVSVEIRDPDGYAPKINEGKVNVSLHYPNGTALLDANLTSVDGSISSDGTKLIFDFDNETILDITNSIKLATDLPGYNPYSLRFFWTNGTIIGCTKIPVYIDGYSIDLTNVTYDRDTGKNQLIGVRKDDALNDYNLLIASINETTGTYTPGFYTVNNSISQSEGTFTYTLDGTDLSVHMTNFLQNETILNPNEILSFKAIIKNLNNFADVNINISIKLVSLANENWIIAQNTSSSQKLEENGSDPTSNYIKEFSLDLKIPDINPDSTWHGINAPIRQCGAKAIVSIYIQNNRASGTYISNNYSLVVNVSDDIFEGYILASELSGASGFIFHSFERHECVYLPNQTTFMVNVYDDFYVSSYSTFTENFNLTLDSEFINISIDPELIYKGQIFKVSSILTTEFGMPLINKSVYCQYYYGDNWINISNAIKSNLNGSLTFQINTLPLNIENSLLIRLVWSGDLYILNNTKEISIDLNSQNNEISIYSEDDESLVYRNKINYFKVNFKNDGDSVLKITDIVVAIDDKNTDSDIINTDEYILSRLEPGDDFDIIIEIEIEDDAGSTLEISITIYAINILSNEPIIEIDTFEAKVLDEPLTDYVIEYSVFFILAILALGCILVYIFVKRTNKNIEKLMEEKVEEKPRVSRYVKVSELKPEKIEEKAEVQKETKELEELETKEILSEEKKEEKVMEPVKSEKIEKTDVLVPPKEKISEKIEKQEISTKKEKKLAKKVKRKEKEQKDVKKKPLSTKELVKLKKAEKRKGLFKKGGKKPKKLPKKVQVKKAKKKSTTDFDEILKEKGLND